MNGECDKCGQHSLECFCAKHIADLTAKFFYQGKFFEKEDEFWAFVKDFSLRQTTADDFEGLFDMLKKDVWTNLSMRQSKITNQELRPILEEAMMFILKKCWDKRGSK